MATMEAPATALHLLVVIDHHEARVYRTEVREAVPERIVPYDPYGYGRHLHSAHEWTDGKSRPEQTSFYEAIANTLRGAQQVLLFGSGTGKSSAMEHLCKSLKEHHPDVAKKIIGAVTVDAHHMTEHQVLAQARDFYDKFNQK